MGYIHPEKLFNIGISKRDKILNYMNMVYDGKVYKSDEEINQMMSELSKKDYKFLISELERSRDKNGKLLPELTYKLRLLTDIYEKYPNRKVPTFKASNNFFNTVKNIRRAIPYNHLDTHGDIYYILFNHDVFEGAYIDMIKSNTIKESGERAEGIRIFLITKEYSVANIKHFLFFNTSGEFNISSMVKIHNLNDIDDNVDCDFYMSSHPIDEFVSIIYGLINSLVYINSQDPDIESLKPMRLYQKSFLTTLDNDKKESICTIPVKLLGWGFHGRNYSKDKSTVSAHMRWQPCGEGRKDIKLVFVKEHTRKYRQGVI